MSEKVDRKQAMEVYKSRDVVGGLYRIVNTKNGWQSALVATQNLDGQRNRFQFGKDTNACFDMAAKEQWNQFGPEAFEFVVVEQLEKKPDQSAAEFKEELKALLAMWEGK